MIKVACNFCGSVEPVTAVHVLCSTCASKALQHGHSGEKPKGDVCPRCGKVSLVKNEGGIYACQFGISCGWVGKLPSQEHP